MPIRLDLTCASRLLKSVPQPWKAIHISGTNGKGSTAHYLARLLSRSGYNIGVFTTPHLIHPRESIKISSSNYDNSRDDLHDVDSSGGMPRPLSVDSYDKLMDDARQRSDGIAAQHRRGENEADEPEEKAEWDSSMKSRRPTEFEMLTQVAFRAFAGAAMPENARLGIVHRPVEFGIVECGMGGLRDATNAMSAERVCSVVTSISLDHQALLGDTVAEIAREKAGIFRRGVPVVMHYPADAVQAPDILEVVREKSKEAGVASLHLVNADSEIQAGVPEVLQQPAFRSILLNMAGALKAFTLVVPQHRRDKLDWAQDIETPATRRRIFMDLLQNNPPGRLQEVFVVASPAWTLCNGPPGKEIWARSDGSEPQTFNASSTGNERIPLECGYRVLIDGAHNPESVRVMRKYVASTFLAPQQDVTWVIALTRGRDPQEFVEALDIRPADKVYCVEFPAIDTMPWISPTPAQELADAVRHWRLHQQENWRQDNDAGSVHVCDPAHGFVPANNLTEDSCLLRIIGDDGDVKRGSNIVVTGSLYLVSYFMRMFPYAVCCSDHTRLANPCD